MRPRFSLAALAGLSLLSGCEQPSDRNRAPPVATETAAQLPSLPVVEPALDREALLLAVTRAASRAWLGADDRDQQRELDGRRFALRLRFGCGGPAGKDSAETRRWRFDDARRVLTLKVAADISKDGLERLSFAMPKVEAVEGFWIERPWVLQAACPPAAEAQTPPVQPSAPPLPGAKPGPAPSPSPSPSPSPALVAAPQVGIAQFFTEADARTHRRDGRAYEATKTLAEGATPSASGYDLVISGRLRRTDEGRVIACRTVAPTAPPTCVISAEFDAVAIEPAGGGETVATWSGA